MLRYLRVATAIAAILAVAACGSAPTPASSASVAPDPAYPGQTAAQVLDRARKALSGVDAVRIDLSTTADTSAVMSTPSSGGSTATPVALSLTVVNGVGSSGTASVNGGTVRLRMIGDTTYSQLDAKVLEVMGPFGASLSSVIGDKWMAAAPDDLAGMAGATGQLGAVSAATSFDSPFSALESTVPPDATLSRVPGKAVGGVQTTGVHFAGTGSAADAQAASGTVYVAATGTPYPLMIERGSTHLVLSHWNQKVAITKPPAGQIVTLADLGLGGGLGGGLSGGLNDQIADQLSGYTG